MKTVWLTFFYAPINPTAYLFSIVGLFFFYWIEKYALLRRTKKPISLSHDLNRMMIELLEYAPLISSGGLYLLVINSVPENEKLEKNL